MVKVYESKLNYMWNPQGTFTTNTTPKGLEILTAPKKALDGEHCLFFEFIDRLAQHRDVSVMIRPETGETCIVTPYGMKIGWILGSIAKIYKMLQGETA